MKPQASDDGTRVGQFHYPLNRDSLSRLLQLLKDNPAHTYTREGNWLVVRTKDGTDD